MSSIDQGGGKRRWAAIAAGHDAEAGGWRKPITFVS
jgi:hypothetical protein